MTETRLIAGCMTGTSIDSLDAALVEIAGLGLSMTAGFVRGLSRPLGLLAPRLRRLADQLPVAAGEIAELSREFSLFHAEVLGELAGGEPLHLAAVHGQTIFHAPPLSWQLLTPAPIAAALRCPVVFDLRAADLAAGGQGAPITPLADWVLFRQLAPAAVVNLGGFCNITLLHEGATPEETEGRDLCPCNHLLDGLARRLFGAPYDEGGRHALGGRIHTAALDGLLRLLAQRAAGRRSLGTGDESTQWIERWRSETGPADLAATACEAIARTIAAAVPGRPRVLLAGGGVRNLALVRAIETACAAFRVEPISAHGVPAEYREAVEMAVLGALCEDRLPITLPRITGVPAPAPLAGAWVYP
jgi:anhydro-N-acetylmuramic acid kinase